MNLKTVDQMEEFRRVDEKQNDFLTNISHELRTPITAIKGSLDLLKRGTLGQLNDGQLDLIDISIIATERLLGKIDQIMNLSRKDYDDINLNKVDVIMDNLLEDAYHLLKSLFDEKQQRVLLQLEARVNIQLDKQLMFEVILNLMSNANKYTPQEGVITIHTYVRSNRLYVEINDNGIGISTENQQNLFKKYYRINEEVYGTGLGLFISKQTIEHHGGRIWVVSKPGEGAQFAFAIPLHDNSNHNQNFREI